jgi:rSAM/selenodomain-associated transferase 2|tara:strand:+ start:3987 stop:4670 length:684 start_codon:yes stop_codon:yes gene_type:complete
MRLSIVIPVLNDSQRLEYTLAQLQPLKSHGVELIVVDGGSVDNSVCIAESLAHVVLNSSAGRALQMNTGAQLSQGEYLLFLHADSQLPSTLLQNLDSWYLAAEKWGFFKLQLDDKRWPYRMIASAINWRSSFTRVSTGDQCQFFRRAFFEQLGGFPNLALMEDIAISKLARREIPPCIVSSQVLTSARRWQAHGWVKTIVFMWSCRLAYCLGVPTTRLAKMYYAKAK